MLVLTAVLLSRTAGFAQPVPALTITNTMPLRDVVARVIERNESIQVRILEHEISLKGLAAEKGIYEPAVVGSYNRIDASRPNNAQAQRSLLTSQFNERNSIYDGGLEFLAPSGAKFKTGITLRDLQNNLQRQQGILSSSNVIDREYEWFTGVSVVQPLLKNFGPAATNVRIRLAAIASDLAFQEYRRQLMLTVAKTESAYWDLFLTQEQERLSIESRAVAEKILGDNRNRVALGRSSEIEVLQAQAGLSLRESRVNDARLKRLQSVSQLTTLFSEPGMETNLVIVATDRPLIREQEYTYFDSFQQAFNLNPDYLGRRKQIQQENIRLAYAKNQRLPQLDLKGSYGLNGLGQTPGEAWDDLHSTEFPAWSVGVELRIPVTGGVRERNELQAARLSKQKALLGLKEVETQIANALESALIKVKGTRENVRNYREVAGFHEKLLKTQIERLDLGRIDSRTVLETEERLFESRIAVLDGEVQYQKSLLELELVSGSTLQLRELDITKTQLQERTAALARERRWSMDDLRKYARQAEGSDPHGDMSPASLDQRRAAEKLHEATAPKTYPPMSAEEQLKAVEILREKMKELP